MARTAREKSSTGIYHVMMRGINKQSIFLEDADKDRFLAVVRGAILHTNNLSGRKAGEYEVYAYALMGNHFHMLVNVISGELGEFVKKIAAGYVRYFNKKYGRDGHLFKERFKSEPCENLSYFGVLMGYITQNPLKHGFCKSLEEYRYTSWWEYFDPVHSPIRICNVNYVLKNMDLEDLKEVVLDMVPDYVNCLDIGKSAGKMSDDAVIACLLEKHGITDPAELKNCEKGTRERIVKNLMDLGGGVRQISRLTGVDKSTLSRLK